MPVLGIVLVVVLGASEPGSTVLDFCFLLFFPFCWIMVIESLSEVAEASWAVLLSPFTVVTPFVDFFDFFAFSSSDPADGTDSIFSSSESLRKSAARFRGAVLEALGLSSVLPGTVAFSSTDVSAAPVNVLVFLDFLAVGSISEARTGQ